MAAHPDRPLTDATGADRRPLLRVEALGVEFPTPGGGLRPVVRVDLELAAGEMVGLVGESGSGKTLTALSLLDLLPPPGRWSGEVRLGETSLRSASKEQRRRLRGRGIGMVFQEATAALNPVSTVGAQLAETIRFHRRLTRAEARREGERLLEQVAIPDPRSCLAAYPHQLSGGQRQRAVIALALACEPRVLVADEPTTALDVTVQSEILDLLDRLRRELGLAILLITHDLAVVAECCERLYVMYAGSIVEEGSVERVLHQPAHPYTRALLACLPRLGSAIRGRGELRVIPGAAPAPDERPAGCAFHPRCDSVVARCREAAPTLEPLAGRRVSCWRAEEWASPEQGVRGEA